MQNTDIFFFYNESPPFDNIFVCHTCSDFHGSWDEVTGMNAPLYYQGYGNEEFNIHRCVENFVALGVPRDRISKYRLLSSVQSNHFWRNCTLKKTKFDSTLSLYRHWTTILRPILQIRQRPKPTTRRERPRQLGRGRWDAPILQSLQQTPIHDTNA